MEQSEPQTKQKRFRVIYLIVYAFSITSAVVCGCGWIFSSHLYLLDLLVSQQILLAWWSLIVLVTLVIMRRWKTSMLALVMCMLAFYPIGHKRTLSLPEVDFASKPEGAIRVVSCNINPENEHWEAALLDLMGLDADVIIVIEVPADLSRAIRKRSWLDDKTYQHHAFRPPVAGKISQGLILSRYPLEPLDRISIGSGTDQILMVQMDHPTGHALIGLMHPYSPRTQTRWHDGNLVIWDHLAALKQVQQRYETSIFGIDLNGGPAQYRARTLRSHGLSASKPLLRLGGTYPTQRRGNHPMRVYIDDVWAAGSRPVAWSSIRIQGSDHMGIITDLVID